MPQPKRKKTVDQPDANTASGSVVSLDDVRAAGGYVPARRTRIARATKDNFPRLTPDDEQLPFWAEIDDALTFRQLAQIPTDENATYADQMRAIAPYVYNWNAWGELDGEPGTWAPVPAPAVGGWEMFQSQTLHVTSFLVACLKYQIDLLLPKGSTRSTTTDSGENENDET